MVEILNEGGNKNLELDPNKIQRQASSPYQSVWVSASAGSGKTKVLTDRVLSLLLTRARPEKILCITFTKAAASEMSIRVNKKLGEWATMPSQELQEELAQLMGISPNEDDLQLARQLFARVLDTAGGLKIMTLHSFCQSLLARFPIEAGVSPQFQILDDRSAQEMLSRAQDRLLRQAQSENDMGRESDLDTENSPLSGLSLSQSLTLVTRYSNEDAFATLMQSLIYERGRLKRLLHPLEGESREDAFERVVQELYQLLQAQQGVSEDQVISETCAEGSFERSRLREAMLHLQSGTATDQKIANGLDIWLSAVSSAERQALFHQYRACFLTTDLSPRKNLMTKKLRDARPELLDILVDEQDRLVRMTDKISKQVTAQASEGLLRLGRAMLEAYEAEKITRDLLDFDDLILKSVSLLTRNDGMTAWVMYKLDGGLDHVLIDEAQDTNPEQWQIVEALTQEFFTGEGQETQNLERFEYDMPRTVFAVGDEKQSIYSFQRADPAEFHRMQAVFENLVTSVEQKWQLVPMDISFRSTGAILKSVDAVFDSPIAKDGVVPMERQVQHSAFRQGDGGIVEVWPIVQADRLADPDPWLLPTETEKESSPKQRLADAVAQQIANWIGQEDLVSKGRKITAGDIMILVRRRDAFVDLIVRALKRRHIAVAGVDRMILSEQISVMDLMVLAQFLILPDDDLALATVLKSPLIGLTDDDLIQIAPKRGVRSLWFQLREVSTTNTNWKYVVEWLSKMLGRTDFIRPFELFSGILSRECPAIDRQETRILTGREAFVARLGAEVEDPLEEFLAMCLSYEQGNAPSLQGFIQWFHAGKSEIKRDLEAGIRDEVRIMTIHGSKGLQAPIVIMPDTTSVPGGRDLPLRWIKTEMGQFPVWTPKALYQESVGKTAADQVKKAQMQEYKRLLYVALTRAEDRLLICGSAGTNGASADCWHEMVVEGMSKIGESFDFEAPISGEDCWTGQGWRYQEIQQRPPKIVEVTEKEKVEDQALPTWMRQMPDAEPLPPKPLIPSLSEEDEEIRPPARSPLGQKGQDFYKRGRLVHRLLQSVPDLSPNERRNACLRYLGQPAHDLSFEIQEELASEVMAILEDSTFAQLFGPGSRAEVPVVGLLTGDKPQLVSAQIDRLIVSDHEVFIVDYKTLRPSPMEISEVPPAYLKQMASYRSVLEKIYPNHKIRCALLWTDGPRIMELGKGQLDLFSPSP